MEPQPHQIVGYSALAQDERAALQAARALVEQQIERDARRVSVDLMDLLSHPAAEPYLQAAAHEAQGDDPLRRAQFAPASSRPFVKMPAVLEQAIAGVQYEMFAGLFPELNHAWLTVDHRFFMWDYEDAHGGFVQYDGLDQSIVSAALVRPPPGAFGSAGEVPFVVLLATPLEVTVLCVRLSAEGGGGLGGSRLELFHSGVRVLTDNVNMVKMVGGPNGRAFMAGADGFLYELQLRSPATSSLGWWAARATKRPCSRRLERVRHFVLSALYESNDPIIELLVDSERNVLVTLSRAGTVQLYTLGAGGDEIQWLCSKTAGALKSELAHAPSKCVRRGAIDLLGKDIEAAASPSPSMQAAPLVSACAIPRAVSREVQLLLTSASGVRLFLSYGQGSTALSQQLHTLRAYAALDPPPAGLVDTARPADDGRFSLGGAYDPAGFAARGGAGAAARGGAPGGAGGGVGAGDQTMAVPLDGALYAAGCSLLVDARALPHAELVCLAPIPAAGALGGGGGGWNGGGRYAGAGGGLGGGLNGFGGSPSLDELCESATRLKLSSAVYALCQLPSPAALSPFAPFGPSRSAAAAGSALAAAGGYSASAGNGNTVASGLQPASAAGVVALADERGALDELVSQLLTAPRRFAALTAAGVHVFEKRRPLELFASALAQGATENLERESALRHAFARFGAVEACAMALTIGALMPPSARAAAPAGALSGVAICAWVRQLGGEARRDRGNAAAAGATSFGQAIEPDSVRFSGRHGGVCAVAARLLACAWDAPIMAVDERNGGMRVARSRAQWLTLAGALRRVVAFLQAHKQAWGLQPASSGAPAMAAGALGGAAPNGLHPEQQRVEAQEEAAASATLLRLLERSAQAASLVALLADADAPPPPSGAAFGAAGGGGAASSWAAASPDALPFAFVQRLAARLPGAEQAALAKLSFANLVCPPHGAGAGAPPGAPGAPPSADRLVRALLLELLRDHGGEPALVARLQRDAPFFFSTAEYALYCVWADLASASASTAPPTERARALRGALRACVEHVQAVDLRAVVSLFSSLGLFEAIVDLPLARAAAVDPSDAARGAVVAGGMGDPEETRALSERLAAYRVAADALQALLVASSAPQPPPGAQPAPGGARDAPAPRDMWRRVIDYGLQRRPADELFHYALFWWLLAAGHAAALPTLDSPFLETFLTAAADCGPETVARTWGPMLRGPDGAADVSQLCAKIGNLEPLASFYVRRGRHVQAARAFAELAERAGGEAAGGLQAHAPPPTLEQREAWLASAIIAARAAGEAGAALGPDFIRVAEQRLQVARAQGKVLAELSVIARSDVGAKRECEILRSGLLEIGILFSLCERYELHLPALAVLAVAAPYQPYSDKVEFHLDQLLQRALAGGWAAACDTVRELRAHFCAPSGAEAYVFRLDQICGTLERERASAPDASPSAVVELLSQGVEPRVPWEALWRAYANAHTRGSRMQAMWEESSALRIHLFGAILALAQGWVRCQVDGRSLGASRQSVCSALDSFIVELNTMTEPEAPKLRDAFKALRKELTPGAGQGGY